MQMTELSLDLTINEKELPKMHHSIHRTIIATNFEANAMQKLLQLGKHLWKKKTMSARVNPRWIKDERLPK